MTEVERGATFTLWMTQSSRLFWYPKTPLFWSSSSRNPRDALQDCRSHKLRNNLLLQKHWDCSLILQATWKDLTMIFFSEDISSFFPLLPPFLKTSFSISYISLSASSFGIIGNRPCTLTMSREQHLGHSHRCKNNVTLSQPLKMFRH